MQLITQEEIAVELRGKGVSFSTLGLDIPVSTTEQEWADIGKKLCRCAHVMNWWIADWAAFGDKQWGAVKKFAQMNGWAEKTIYNAANVARSVACSRRRDDLSFGHHEAVASLPARKQTQMLARAHDESLPVGELRRIIRKRGGEDDASQSDGIKLNWPQDRPVADMLDWLKNRPPEFWTPEVKDWWKDYLKPVVEFYNSL